jgi:hypothetical protein
VFRLFRSAILGPAPHGARSRCARPVRGSQCRNAGERITPRPPTSGGSSCAGSRCGAAARNARRRLRRGSHRGNADEAFGTRFTPNICARALSGPFAKIGTKSRRSGPAVRRYFVTRLRCSARIARRLGPQSFEIFRDEPWERHTTNPFSASIETCNKRRIEWRK